MSALSLLERSPGSNNSDSTTSLLQLYEKAKRADKNVVLSKTLRALMLRQFINGNDMINFHQTNNEFDETICSELVAFAKNMFSMEQNQLAMKYTELILMVKRAAANEQCDRVTRLRLQNLFDDTGPHRSVNGVDDGSLDPYDYYENYFHNMQQRFGCSSRTSCSIEGCPIIMTNGMDKNHAFDKFERSLNRVLQASQDLYTIYENCEKKTNLRKFANEIKFVHNLFDQLKQQIDDQ